MFTCCLTGGCNFIKPVYTQLILKWRLRRPRCHTSLKVLPKCATVYCHDLLQWTTANTLRFTATVYCNGPLQIPPWRFILEGVCWEAKR